MNKEKALQIIAENKKSYNIIAEDFDICRQTAWPEFELLAAYLHKSIKAQKHESTDAIKILDVGCGNGRLYQYLWAELLCAELNSAHRYVGIDQSEELIKIAKVQCAELNSAHKVEFIVADVFDLSFKNGEFDVAVGIAFLHHIPGEELRLKVLKEIYRVLKPGGILFLTNWNLRQWKLIKKYKLRIRDFFFSHDDLDAGDFWIPFKYNCHSDPVLDTGEESQRSFFARSGAPQDDRVMRYYHHLKKREIIDLCKKAGFMIVEYKKGKNSILILKK